MGRPGHPGDPRRVRCWDASRQEPRGARVLESVHQQGRAANGVKTFYWDNGAQPGTNDAFALFNRSTGRVVDQAVLDAILLGSGVGDPDADVHADDERQRLRHGEPHADGQPAARRHGRDAHGDSGAGYQFAGWTGEPAGRPTPITIRILGNTTVTANFIPQGTGGTGTILREYWLNVTGTTVSSLTSNSGYPYSPTGSEQLTSLEGATNIGDNYGSRIRGYIHPLITGAYTFWFASDDDGDLLLSTNDNPANATRIAFVAELDRLAPVDQVRFAELGGAST